MKRGALLIFAVVAFVAGARAGDVSKRGDASSKYANVSEDEKLFPSADIASIKLGMSVDQVRAVLKKHPTLTQYKETTGQVPNLGSFMAGIYASAPFAKGSAASDTLTVSFTQIPGKEVVHTVRRDKFFDAPGASEEIVSAMIKKYGEPWRGSAQSGFAWRSAPPNALFPDSKGNSSDRPPCGPKSPSMECGAADVSAILISGPRAGPGLSMGYSIELTSFVLRVEADEEFRKLAADARADHDKKRVEDAKKATKTDL